jgi:hypothetical protein
MLESFIFVLYDTSWAVLSSTGKNIGKKIDHIYRLMRNIKKAEQLKVYVL